MASPARDRRAIMQHARNAERPHRVGKPAALTESEIDDLLYGPTRSGARIARLMELRSELLDRDNRNDGDGAVELIADVDAAIAKIKSAGETDRGDHRPQADAEDAYRPLDAEDKGNEVLDPTEWVDDDNDFLRKARTERGRH